jgi:hypothetical protein
MSTTIPAKPPRGAALLEHLREPMRRNGYALIAGADVERRAEEARAREAAAKQAAVEAWINWYKQTHLLTKRSDRRS